MTTEMAKEMKILDATEKDYKITDVATVPGMNSKTAIKDTATASEGSKYYTVYSYRLARTLLRKGCSIADLGLNTKMKGIVFHFKNEPKLHEVIKLQRQINDARRQMDKLNNPSNPELLKRNGEKREIIEFDSLSVNDHRDPIMVNDTNEFVSPN